MADQNKSITRRLMAALQKLMPGDATGENVRAVRMFGRMLRLKDLFSDRLFKRILAEKGWPVTSGSYIVGDRSATVAVCTLTSPELMKPLSRIKGVAIAGELVTVNLGIEKIILNTISNPNIRYLLLCGKESPVFYPGQALQCLFQKGIDNQRRIKEAEGHFPVLNNLNADQIERFRRQVELIDCTGEQDEELLRSYISELDLQNRSPISKNVSFVPNKGYSFPQKKFKKIRPGGKRDTPAHEMRARRAGSMMRALVQEGLISQLSHAGYLGVELAKAETALRLGLDYEQDHPIKKST